MIQKRISICNRIHFIDWRERRLIRNRWLKKDFDKIDLALHEMPEYNQTHYKEDI